MITSDKIVDFNKVRDGNIEYTVEKLYMQRLLKICDRLTNSSNQNAFMDIHGKPGEGKTNTAVMTAHVCKLLTGRPIHLYFGLPEMIRFAQSTEKQIIIWDEPSLHALSTDHMTKMYKNLQRLINMGRRKRHLMIVCLTKFWRFPYDLVVDTCLNMVHMNSKNGSTPGRFLYIPQDKLEKLWEDHAKKGKNNFAKYKRFGGQIPYIIEKYMGDMDITVEGRPNCTFEMYEEEKDRAIGRIGQEDIKLDKDTYKLAALRKAIASMDYKNITSQEEFANRLGFYGARLREWRKIDLKSPRFLEEEGFEGKNEDEIITNMVKVPQKSNLIIEEAQSLPSIRNKSIVFV